MRHSIPLNDLKSHGGGSIDARHWSGGVKTATLLFSYLSPKKEDPVKTFLSSMLLLFIGCGLDIEQYITRTFDLDSTIDATVGDVMITWEEGSRSSIYGWKFDGVRKSLVYSGIASNVIKVHYRELYVDERWLTAAKQPFHRELQYDLTLSKLITFQDVRLEVLDANSERITFKVLQPPSGFEKAQKE